MEIGEIASSFNLGVENYDKNFFLINCPADILIDIAKKLKENGFNYMHTVSVVDYTPENKGFQVNYIVENMDKKQLVMLRVNIDGLKVPSLCSVFPSVQPHEREEWEMFGIEFVGNPRLELMLLPDDAKGKFPLRKSYTFEKHKRG